MDVSLDKFVWLFGTLCRAHRIPFNSRLLLQRHPPSPERAYSVTEVIQAAGELGLNAAEVPYSLLDESSTFPVLAFLQPGQQPEHTEETPLRGRKLALILGVREDSMRYIESGAAEPVQCAVHDMEERFERMCCVFIPKPETLHDEDGIRALAPKPFGFSWFVPELMKHRRVWLDVLLASLALQCIGLATPLFTQVIIDKVVVHQTHSTLVAVAVGLVIAIVFSATFTWVRQYLLLHTGNKVDSVLGSRVFSHLIHLPLAYFRRRPTGTLVARLQGIETIREFISGAAITLFLDLPFMVVLLAVMFWYSWQLSLVALGLLSLLALLSSVVTPVLRGRLNKQFLLGARNQAFVTEYVSSVETVKALQLEPQLDRRFSSYLSEYLSASFATRQVGNTYNTIAQTLEQLHALMILGIGALLVMRNDGFTIGMLVAFQMFAARLSQPLIRIVGLYQEFQQASLAVKRLGDMMDVPAEPHTITPSRKGNSSGLIEFRSAGFRYGDEQPWLFRGLSFSVNPGTTTLVTGVSGSGKSTLCKLMLGLYRPVEGQILVDGQDTRHYTANELRNRFGVVPQETVLFSGTVYENLQIAEPTASFDDIVRACRMAEIHETIESLPKGYQTELGERGVGLSGGQRQRIAIARALVKRPKILILDEASANVDVQTAERLALTINRLRGKITVIIIAHQAPKGLLVDGRVVMGEASENNPSSSNKDIGESRNVGIHA